MNIETRFDLGQTVYRVARAQHKDSDGCAACGGDGRLDVARKDGTMQRSYCEACNGRGVINELWYDLYEVVDESPVGQIEIRLRSRPHIAGDPEREERYMIEATGVGSGTIHALAGDGEQQVWTHSHLFATRAEAEQFCAVENDVIRAHVEATRARLRSGVPA